MGFKRTIVLVASDDNSWVPNMQQILDTVGYIPVPLLDVRSMLDSVEAIKPDVVLLGPAMKRKNALSAARGLKEILQISTPEIAVGLRNSAAAGGPGLCRIFLTYPEGMLVKFCVGLSAPSAASVLATNCNFRANMPLLLVGGYSGGKKRLGAYSPYVDSWVRNPFRCKVATKNDPLVATKIDPPLMHF
ncbi:MAG: hypothetical protein WC532_08990 [Candidatus Omnitrophota bacterium]